MDRDLLGTCIDDIRAVVTRLRADGQLLTQPTFFEVTIDPTTAHSTPVQGGLCASVGAFEFSVGF